MRRWFWGRRIILLLNCTLLIAISFLFCLLFTLNNNNRPQWGMMRFPKFAAQRTAVGRSRHQFRYKINDNRGKEVTIVDLLLPEGSAGLRERAMLGEDGKQKTPKEPSILLMYDLDFSDTNIRGCPDWNCKVTRDHSLLPEARAIFFGSSGSLGAIKRKPGQYFVHYSQESPVNMPSSTPDHFNMSFGFRMDGNGAASPYGFAARLAPESRPKPEYLNELLTGVIKNKKKPVAWFVSHCSTESGREWIASEMQKHIQVDIYGSCGPLKCPKGTECREMLDTDYFFYFAAENSICRDYLTEKIWDQGMDSLSVPIVLRRSLVQHLLPPSSFIAVDDFPTIARLADHLRRLMENPWEYLHYFEWRLKYVTVKLNGDTDPRAERLFGVCQVCRLTQTVPRPAVTLPEPMNKWWDGSCEQNGKLVEQFKSNKNRAN